MNLAPLIFVWLGAIVATSDGFRSSLSMAGALRQAMGLLDGSEQEQPASRPSALPSSSSAASSAKAEREHLLPAQDPAREEDSRPVVRLRVKNEFKREDTVFPEVVEGRLIQEVADMETFRTVGADRQGDFLLTVTIRHLELATDQNYKTSRDADSSGTPTQQSFLTATMDVDLALESKEGKEVYRGKLSAQASRELEISVEHTLGLLKQEMIDRAAQRLEKTLRKRLKKL